MPYRNKSPTILCDHFRTHKCHIETSAHKTNLYTQTHTCDINSREGENVLIWNAIETSELEMRESNPLPHCDPAGFASDSLLFDHCSSITDAPTGSDSLLFDHGCSDGSLVVLVIGILLHHILAEERRPAGSLCFCCLSLRTAASLWRPDSRRGCLLLGSSLRRPAGSL